MIKDHFQDAIWIGTDGQGVYLYSNPLYSIKSVVLSNLYRKAVTPVRALHIDDERTLWIGTKGNGIIKAYNYDAKKEIFDCKTEMLTISNSDIGSNAVYCFPKASITCYGLATRKAYAITHIKTNASEDFQS